MHNFLEGYAEGADAGPAFLHTAERHNEKAHTPILHSCHADGPFLDPYPYDSLPNPLAVRVCVHRLPTLTGCYSCRRLCMYTPLAAPHYRKDSV